MSVHLIRDLEHIKRSILDMGGMVEEATGKAIAALVDRRPELARDVIEGDPAIDEVEVGIEEEVLKALALHQPVAIDLRFLVTVLKVNNDLERMADLAVNIAERASFLCTHEAIELPIDILQMGEKVRSMLRQCLDALVEQDVALAGAVLQSDDEIDRLNRKMFEVLQQRMRESPDAIESIVQMLSASRHLERIADHCTNVAEDVVFMVEGEVIRHRGR